MGELKTRILFTENGKPVEGLSVRARDDDDPVETDSDGQVAVPLLEGRQTLRVLRGGKWVPQIVQTNRESSLIVVDLAKRETGEFAKPIDPGTSFLDIGKLNLGERYVYQEIIGRGGMSIVLRAHDRLLNREVAIKVLSQELQAQSEAQQIFLTEARNLATLSHPNLVSVHDICKVDDHVFMVIEYVEGESLEKLVHAVQGFNETVALQTVIQMARVVGYLHDHNIIHRDIKPANAMLRNDGTVKLIDFGLARHFDELQVRGTRVRGTPAYMSPEQIQGEPLTAACDVYQLGVCLFEALTGRLPFAGKGDVGYQHVHEEAPSVLKFRPNLSEELAELLAECLAKDPAARPQNGQELLRRLQLIYQKVGGAGANLYQQIQADAAQSTEVDARGYTTSELRLMEGAGRHLHTSDFKGKTLTDLLADPKNQSRIVIQTGPRWPSILLAGVLTSALGAGVMFTLMSNGAGTSPHNGEFSARAADARPMPADLLVPTPAPAPTAPAQPTEVLVAPIPPAVPADPVAPVPAPTAGAEPTPEATTTSPSPPDPTPSIVPAQPPAALTSTVAASEAKPTAAPPAESAPNTEPGPSSPTSEAVAEATEKAVAEKKGDEPATPAPVADRRKKGLFAPKRDLVTPR